MVWQALQRHEFAVETLARFSSSWCQAQSGGSCGQGRNQRRPTPITSVSECCSHIARKWKSCWTYVVELSKLRARQASQDGTHVFVDEAGHRVQNVQDLGGEVGNALFQELECEAGEVV